jgi:hypothetical protein
MKFTSLDAWIEFHYGSYKAMGERLGFTYKKVNRWYAKSPKQFYQVIEELVDQTGTDPKELIELINGRARDVEMLNLRNGRNAIGAD